MLLTVMFACDEWQQDTTMPRCSTVTCLMSPNVRDHVVRQRIRTTPICVPPLINGMAAVCQRRSEMGQYVAERNRPFRPVREFAQREAVGTHLSQAWLARTPTHRRRRRRHVYGVNSRMLRSPYAAARLEECRELAVSQPVCLHTHYAL